MGKIVDKPIRIDLHIHSVYSSNKDGDKVAQNTVENLPILVSKLAECGVDMCAITDHDTFNFHMYKSLKSYEGRGLCKVLPGIEFSVNFNGDKVIHIVTIFDDRDERKIQRIEDIFAFGIGKTSYVNGAYSREDYFRILKEIDVDFVMIAHQKKSLTSTQSPQKRDALSLGRETFNELLFMEYFDAYEFRQRDNEAFNKSYSINNDVKEKLRMITGSDCHNWMFYPNSNDHEEDAQATFLKALPTFKGLVMAITDYHRISYTGSFWGQGKYVNELIVKIDGKKNRIPLSRGINVIIGDNSVGKSMLLHELTSERAIENNQKLKKGYLKYLKDNSLEIETKINENDIFKFNYQGQIREIFEDENLKADKYLEEFFPNEIDPSGYRKIIDRELEKFYKHLECKFTYDEKINQLAKFELLDEDSVDNELVLGIEIETSNNTDLQKLVDKIKLIQGELKELIKNKALEKNDRKHIERELEYFEILQKKYEDRYSKAKFERTKKNAFNTALKSYKRKYSERQTDRQNRHNAFYEEKKALAENIANLLKTRFSLSKYTCEIDKTEIKEETNPVGSFLFVSKLNVTQIDKEYFDEVIADVLKKGKKIDLETITKDTLRSIISRYPSEIDNPLEAFKSKISSRLDADFRPTKAIIENGQNVYSRLSDGFNSRIYFTLLSGEAKNKGIYIIDQPEDHISQKRIKEDVLEQFRNMAKTRQIIMVTHNPQFIVNLDVDNVIYISKEGSIHIQSGALEYEDENYSILGIVAENIDGGINTIQQRVKRYEKNI